MKISNFETTTCSRCHATGRHSFCRECRDVCFKCKGSGVVLTKRGEMAKAYFLEISSVSANELKVGDKIPTLGITMDGKSYNYIATVDSIEKSNTNGSGGAGRIDQDGGYTSVTENGVVTITKNEGGVISTSTDTYLSISMTSEKYGKSSTLMAGKSRVRVYGDDQKEKLEQALAYQESLTKSGTIRKTNTKKK